MDILKLSLEWAKDEIFSSRFFVFFGLCFLVGAIGFWQLGKSEMARAYLYPLLICGSLLLLIGVGLLYTNYSRVKTFQIDHANDVAAFVKSEALRAEKTITEYERVVFIVIPIMIAIASIMLVFIELPNWRAICISTIAMLTVILLIDSNAYTRMKVYKRHLMQYEEAAIQP